MNATMGLIKLSFISILLSCSILATSCSKKYSPEEFTEHLFSDKSGLLKSVKVSTIDYKVLYSHPQYETIKRLSSTELQNDTLRNETYSNVEEQCVFYFKMMDVSNEDLIKKNISTNEAYNERLSYLINGIQNDFQLISGIDTIDCSIHHFERGYGINPTITITVAFEKPKKDEELTFIYTDQLFNAGRIKYRFDPEDYSKIYDITYL